MNILTVPSRFAAAHGFSWGKLLAKTCRCGYIGRTDILQQ